MRDHKKLKTFQLADELVLAIYRLTRSFPRDEDFALKLQMRRAVVSVPCNIVEGCARNTERDYLHFLDTAFASAQEVHYQLSLAHRLRYASQTETTAVLALSDEVCRALNGLIQNMRT